MVGYASCQWRTTSIKRMTFNDYRAISKLCTMENANDASNRIAPPIEFWEWKNESKQALLRQV